MDRDLLPLKFRSQVDDLRDATGIEPEVTDLGHHKWRICVSNERVHMYVDFKILSNEKLKWLGSELLVDGSSRPLAKDEYDLADIMRNPDRTASVSDMPGEASVSQAPGIVKHYYSLLASKLEDAVMLGVDRRMWVIGIGEGPHGIRISFVPSRQMRRNYNIGIQIVLEGVDRSAEVRNDLSAALALLLGASAGEPGSSPGSSSTPVKDGKRFDSVQQRKSSVFRI